MELVEAFSCKVQADIVPFEDAMEVWRTRPQVVSRRLCGCVSYNGSKNGQVVPSVNSSSVKLFSFRNREHQENTRENLVVSDKVSLTLQSEFVLEPKGYELISRVSKCLSDLRKPSTESTMNSKERKIEKVVEISLRKLLPRQLDKYNPVMELMAKFSEYDYVWYVFIPLSETNELMAKYPGMYAVKFYCNTECKEKSMVLYVDKQCASSHDNLVHTLMPTPQWLTSTLLPKLKSWAEENQFKSVKSTNQGSLCLLSLEKYNMLYNDLKRKYADYLIKICPENTDPLKFVYEDIAIAAYLILTWEKNGKDKLQTFVDIGCGNGLLVYLLNQEGYSGLGIDIRRRKIWDLFAEKANLREFSVFPNEAVFHFDWIIGNHSDEMTPWIPVIAARSSANYFNIPCCFYTFQGKYQRNSGKETQYQQYLQFVREIGQRCGFTVEDDKLRIPSTKRACQIGWQKDNWSGISDNMLNELLKSYDCELMLNDATHIFTNKIMSTCLTDNKDCVCNERAYVPRSGEIRIRNCTKVDIEIRNKVVQEVFLAILHTEKKVAISIDHTRNCTSKGFALHKWNPGGEISLHDIVGLFDKKLLSELKAQCGGIKTLLKNHGHIFQVIKGKVRFRSYSKEERLSNVKVVGRKGSSSRKSQFRKTKPCWFDCHHPQGCLLSAECCDFIHNEENVT